MLGIYLFQYHGAIYSQSQDLGSWQSDDTVTTWSRGPADMCMIKGDDLTLSRDVFVASASMMPEPAAESHGYSIPLICGQFVIFWVAKESPTTVDP
jgi:hypothetical protein